MQSRMATSTSGRCSTRYAATGYWQHTRLVTRPRSIRCRASNTSDDTFAQRAQEFAETAQQRVQDFVKQQKLEEKAAAAGQSAKQKLTEAYEETEQNVRRTFMKLESEHNFSSKIDGAKRKVAETARDIDQEYSVSRKVKSAYADAKRMWPTWKRQFSDFSQTQVGKTTLLATFVALLFSGALWQVLNVVWLLWWLSIPVSLLVANQNRRAAQQAAATGSNPFTGGPWGSSNSSGFGSSGFGSSSNSSHSTRGSNADEPVVDAEWVSLDDSDSSSSSSSSSSRGWRR
eukprot:GHUV01004744.1.p1 GENE.GHUV01004744.1~~GHUV01004744.1.p1  ORF type:complete len:287 (+),score=109.23 GHUV01004744.1:298-1158(+)